jgi:nitrate/TMAO reductase-like tetraheme cytochrome c subunit
MSLKQVLLRPSIFKSGLTGIILFGLLAFCMSPLAADKDDDLLLDDPPAAAKDGDDLLLDDPPATDKSGDDLLLDVPPAANNDGDDLLLDASPSANKDGDDLLSDVPSATDEDGDDLLLDVPSVQRKTSKGDDLLLDGDEPLDSAPTEKSAVQNSDERKADAPPPKNNASDEILDLILGGGVVDHGAMHKGAINHGIGKNKKTSSQDDPQAMALKAHAALFIENRYPSAKTCAPCHAKHFHEWSVSPHAYAQLSPVFNAMQQTINAVVNGTNGDFCIRCHNPVGINLGESPHITNAERHSTSREGITCIVCHRVNKPYGKISGRLAIVEGDIFQPVYGPSGNEGLQRVLDNREKYKVVTDPNERGRRIHKRAEKFFQLTKPGFCGQCHDVNLYNGFRLEEAFSDYKHSPSAKDGVTCQDCHMGKVPGINAGYEQGPAAVIGGIPTKPRKLTNHMIAGPDYSVIHPALFPHNPKAAEMASLQDWLLFDYKAGWGTDAFEDNVPEDYKFPPRWASIDDRYDAREILKQQFKLLQEYRNQGTAVLQAGYQLGEIITQRSGPGGVKFKVEVRNGTRGHNVPTGFIGERPVFLQVTVTDSTGKMVFESGDLDPNGDIRDYHSRYVHNGEVPQDDQLFNLQSRFLTTMLRGGEREQVLAINYSPDPLAYIRPSTSSTILTGRPAGARIHRVSILPEESRWAVYQVDKKQLQDTTPPYKVNVKLIAAMIPINLIDAIKGVGFDYGMSPRAVADNVVAGHRILWERDVVLQTDNQ